MISEFRHGYDFLSNFYRCEVRLDGKVYPTVEHAFQAAKTIDENLRYKISVTPKAAGAKFLGRKLKLRRGWEAMKVEVMTDLVIDKFMDPTLAFQLKTTGDHELVEGNYWHDNFWGDCLCPKCVDKEGQNFLGRILMATRGEL